MKPIVDPWILSPSNNDRVSHAPDKVNKVRLENLKPSQCPVVFSSRKGGHLATVLPGNADDAACSSDDVLEVDIYRPEVNKGKTARGNFVYS